MKTTLAIVLSSVLAACGGGEDAAPQQSAPLSATEAQAQADAIQAAFNAQEAAKVHADPKIVNDSTTQAVDSADPKMHGMPTIRNDNGMANMASGDKKHGNPIIYNVNGSEQ